MRHVRSVHTVEGALERRELVEETTHRPDIALVVVRLVVADLGRHVVGRAARRPRQLGRVVEHARDPKLPAQDGSSA